MEKEVKIDAPFITLGQLLKEEGIIPTGGAAKWFLKEHEVKVNGELDDRRGRNFTPAITLMSSESSKLLSRPTRSSR
ncbi:RNA-binding S4 domain-containing protein [Limosilactobacillus fermentum]|nr:RNA-binding S4 domain-containing protein [Limosilactobacillus fermentum]